MGGHLRASLSAFPIPITYFVFFRIVVIASDVVALKTVAT